MKKLLFLFGILVSLVSLLSCDIEVNISSENNGTKITFNAVSEKGFEKLLKTFSGDEKFYIDTNEISVELAKSGFSKVQCESKDNLNLFISVLSPDSKTFPFSSGIIAESNNSFVTDFSRENMVKLYNSVSPQIMQILDLFLAPVFNDEEMSQEEYLEVIGAFYGDAIAEELSSSRVRIISHSAPGEKSTKEYSLVNLLCGN